MREALFSYFLLVSGRFGVCGIPGPAFFYSYQYQDLRGCIVILNKREAADLIKGSNPRITRIKRGFWAALERDMRRRIKYLTEDYYHRSLGADVFDGVPPQR